MGGMGVSGLCGDELHRDPGAPWAASGRQRDGGSLEERPSVARLLGQSRAGRDVRLESCGVVEDGRSDLPTQCVLDGKEVHVTRQLDELGQLKRC